MVQYPSHMEELTEKEIIEKIQSGFIDYYEVLVKKYSDILFYYTVKKVNRKEDAEDIIQNSFIKAYKVLDHFDTSKTFYPYLFTILKHEIVEFYRKHTPTIPLDDQQFTTETNQQTDMVTLLSDLKKDHQMVLQLYIEGYTYQEIASKMSKPINTIRTLIRRAKLELRKNLNKHI